MTTRSKFLAIFIQTQILGIHLRKWYSWNVFIWFERKYTHVSYPSISKYNTFDEINRAHPILLRISNIFFNYSSLSPWFHNQLNSSHKNVKKKIFIIYLSMSNWDYGKTRAASWSHKLKHSIQTMRNILK